MMHIKICGITNLEDALNAIRLGADYLGFNFYSHSPRCINEEDCALIVESLRAEGLTFSAAAVFVNHSIDEMARIMDDCGLDAAQLSGDETPETQRQLASRGKKCFRAVRNADGIESILARGDLPSQTPALLIDASIPGSYGGTGQMADWTFAAEVARKFPVFLAGGLNPNNIADAIRQVAPWGVDTASGVEGSPGKKDVHKMRLFIETASTAFASLQENA